MTSSLFSPLAVRGVELRNRVVVSPMQQYAGVDGAATPWHLVHLGARAMGGAGLVMTEATAVSARGRSTSSDLGLWTDAQAESLAPVARFVTEQGAVFGVQLWHAGRKGPRRRPWEGRTPPDHPWKALGATGAALGPEDPSPERATEGDLAQVVADFRSAAWRAHEAGARWLELHAAHGYLVHEFLSPVTNERQDRWGGGQRSRLVKEITSAVREVWPERSPLAVRLSVVDGVPGGASVDDTVALGAELAALGVDVVVASAGGLIAGSTPPLQGEHHGLLPRLRTTGARICVVGGVRDPARAESLVREGGADLVALARAHLRDPHWAANAAAALGAPLPVPPAYLRGW